MSHRAADAHTAEWVAEPSAIVEDGATIGAATHVWHFVHVRSGANIGDRCNIGQNVYIDAGVSIGSGVKIQNNVSVYRGVTIEDDVFLGPSSVFTNDLHPRAAGTDWSLTPTLVKRGASIGANSTIICGVTIGEWATIGAGAVVTRDVEPHQLVVGNPARPAGWMCSCGQVVSRDVGVRPPILQCPDCAAAGPT